MEEINQRVEIELLKKDVSSLTLLLSKFDITIDKIQNIATNLSKIVSLQEHRLATSEKQTQVVQDQLEVRRTEHITDIRELNNRIDTVNRELTSKIEETEKAILDELKQLKKDLNSDRKPLVERLKEIEIWKWMMSGGIAVIIWIIARTIEKIPFITP